MLVSSAAKAPVALGSLSLHAFAKSGFGSCSRSRGVLQMTTGSLTGGALVMYPPLLLKPPRPVILVAPRLLFLSKAGGLTAQVTSFQTSASQGFSQSL